MTGGHSDEEAAWLDLVAQFGAPSPPDGATPWPDREGLPAPPPADRPEGEPTAGEAPQASSGEAPQAGSGAGSGTGSGTGEAPSSPRIRIVRPAASCPVPAAAPAPGEGDHYVPPVPPPLPHLDAVSKGAWLALFGGPGYLLISVLLGWTISGWDAFFAMAALVGGFTTLVVRMGDRPPRDSGPDDGAVV